MSLKEIKNMSYIHFVISMLDAPSAKIKDKKDSEITRAETEAEQIKALQTFL